MEYRVFGVEHFVVHRFVFPAACRTPKSPRIWQISRFAPNKLDFVVKHTWCLQISTKYHTNGFCNGHCEKPLKNNTICIFMCRTVLFYLFMIIILNICEYIYIYVVCVCACVLFPHGESLKMWSPNSKNPLGAYHKFHAFNTRCVVTLYVPEDMSLACRQLCLVHAYCYATFDPPPVLGLSQRGFSPSLSRIGLCDTSLWIKSCDTTVMCMMHVLIL